MDTWNAPASNTQEKDENGNYIVDTTYQTRFANYLKEYLKTIDYSDTRTEELNLLGIKTNTTAVETRKQYAIQLEDGVIIEIGWLTRPNCTSKTYCGDIWITLPGKQWQTGVTNFQFTVYSDHLGYSNSDFNFEQYCDIKNKSGVSAAHLGRGCTQWVLENENMDYLHCEGLGVNGKTKCR